jgi:hypothetical protein
MVVECPALRGRLSFMWREIPGVIVFAGFIGAFVFLMNHISDPSFNGDPNVYSYIAFAVIIFTTLMVYWERIFPAGD